MMAYERAYEDEKNLISQKKKITPRSFYGFQVKKHWKMYAFGAVASLVTSMTEVIVPKFSQWIIDLVSSGSFDRLPQFLKGEDTPSSLDRLVVWLIVVVLIGFVGRILWRQLLARRTHETGMLLRMLLWDRTRYLKSHLMQQYSLGDMINRSTSDVNSARSIHGFTLVLTFDLIFFTVLASISMFMIHWELTLYCLLIMPVLPFLISPLSKKEYRLYQTAQGTMSELSEGIYQSLSTMRMQRSTNMGEVWKARLKGQAQQYAEENYQVVKTAWMIFPLGALPTVLAYIVLLTIGVSRVVEGELSVGGLVAMLSYVLMLQGPLFELSIAITEWQKGFASLDRIAEILNLRNPKKTEHKRSVVLNPKAHLIVKDLSFYYPNSQKLAVDHVSFELPRGTWFGITGKIGAGKTTLLNIIAGIEERVSGEIVLDGQYLEDWPREDLTSHVVVVPQKGFLFSGTIRYNLCLDQEYSDEILLKMIEIVEFKNEFEGFCDGLDTWIGEWGINLSGGQRQRLSLARSLLRAKSLLLMDDCLSAVDAETESKIIANIQANLKVESVIWVAHRESTLKLCDQILMMEDGRLAGGAL